MAGEVRPPDKLETDYVLWHTRPIDRDCPCDECLWRLTGRLDLLMAKYPYYVDLLERMRRGELSFG
jgi:hypothetical protein